MAVLSAEVMCEILDLVVPCCDTRYNSGARPPYAELKQLALVCRSWATYIHYRLFNHVDLGSFDARLAFLRTIGRNTTRSRDLKQTTRRLVLSGPIFRPGGPRDIVDILSQLQSLEIVHVRKDFSLSYLPPSWHVPRNFPAIRSFDIEMNRGSSWETLHDLLWKLPTLQRLAIRDFSAAGSLLTLQDPPFAFRLQEFLFICPWRCVTPAYLNAFLEQSIGSLEVMGMSMMSAEPGMEELVASHAKTVRSLGLDTAENIDINPSLFSKLVRLEQLVITTAHPDLIAALPVTLRRLQFNSAVFTDGRPLVDRFVNTLSSLLARLGQLNELFVAGKHHSDSWSNWLPDAVQLGGSQLDERYSDLQRQCIKLGVELHSSMDHDDTQWARFYDIAYPNGKGD